MATLIASTADLKEYVSTAFNFTFTNIQPYVKRAEREFIKAVIGEVMYDSWVATPPTTGSSKKVYDLLKEASANLSVFLYVPIGAVNISDGGILVISNQTSTPAEWWQVRDLQRSLAGLGLSAIDEAYKILEESENAFQDWIGTEAYTIFKELITPKTQDFQRHFNINNSRRTFVALRPYILETQNQIFNWLDADTLDQIKTGASTEEKQARDYAQAAQVNFSVAKAVETGLFDFTSTGLFLRSLELPGEKTKAVDLLQLEKVIKARLNSAEEYLKLLKACILEKSSVFTTYEEPTVDTTVFVHNTKSIVAF